MKPNNFNFGKKSEEELRKAHDDLEKILRKALFVSRVDFGIVQTHRSAAEQMAYFESGKTKVKRGKHNYYPAEAADILAYVNGKGTYYHIESYIYLAGIIEAVAWVLFLTGETTHVIRWGGNWDQDSEVMTDQNFDDVCHFELVKPLL
jgi:peptidoglycan L-alanyl-D-glutamate endopeptidase CwlK